MRRVSTPLPSFHAGHCRSALTALLILSATSASFGQGVSDVYRRVKNSVVVIKTSETVISPIDRGKTASLQGLGSGVLVSDTQVFTAAHVVQVADVVVVEFADGEQLLATVAASSPQADVALLELERAPERPRPAVIGDSDASEVGDQIIVIGAPYGLAHTLTVGYVSGRLEPNSVGNSFAEMEFIQTDASINEGNSGGPMFNMQGEVVGIVSYILSQSGGSEGLGFAAASNMTQQILLRERALWSGATGYMLEGRLATIFNLPQTSGMLVQSVAVDSPASHLGLRASNIPATVLDQEFLVGGDVVLSIQGVSLATADGMERARVALTRLRAGEELAVEVLRGGERVRLQTTL